MSLAGSCPGVMPGVFHSWFLAPAASTGVARSPRRCGTPTRLGSERTVATRHSINLSSENQAMFAPMMSKLTRCAGIATFAGIAMTSPPTPLTPSPSATPWTPLVPAVLLCSAWWSHQQFAIQQKDLELGGGVA